MISADRIEVDIEKEGAWRPTETVVVSSSFGFCLWLIPPGSAVNLNTHPQNRRRGENHSHKSYVCCSSAVARPEIYFNKTYSEPKPGTYYIFNYILHKKSQFFYEPTFFPYTWSGVCQNPNTLQMFTKSFMLFHMIVFITFSEIVYWKSMTANISYKHTSLGSNVKSWWVLNLQSIYNYSRKTSNSKYFQYQ